MNKFTFSPIRPQNIHQGYISRLGGLSIFSSFLILVILELIYSNQDTNLYFYFILISIPLFFIGLLEDIKQSINPTYRILSSVFSAILFIAFFDILILDVGIPIINFVLNFKLISILFTILCITFLINAFNIIDGLNGLSLSTGIICLLSVSVIAYKIEYFSDLNLICSLISILLGVLVINFPFGKIFIGDSGAYIIGLFVALISIIFIDINPNISPFVIVQILIYPSYELIRSFFRRIFTTQEVFMPDTKHFHSRLYMKNFSILPLSYLKCNNISSIQIIILQLFNFLFVINFFDNEKIILIGILLFITVYEIIYYLIKKN